MEKAKLSILTLILRYTLVYIMSKAINITRSFGIEERGLLVTFIALSENNIEVLTSKN